MILVGALIIGAGIGVLTGMFGVGGGFLITPLLNVVLGVPMPIAVGTGALQILSVSTSGLYRRRHESAADYKLATVLFGGQFAGVRLGALALASLQGLGNLELGGGPIAAADFYVLCVFLVLLSGISGWVYYDTTRKQSPSDVQVGIFSRINLPPYTECASLDQPRISIPVVSYFGLILGFLTGLLGVGGGVIMLPALVYLVGMRTRCATATSLVLIWLSSFTATITHTLAGNSDTQLVIPLLFGGTIGLQVGVSLSAKWAGQSLRRYFFFVVMGATVMVAIKLVSAVF